MYDERIVQPMREELTRLGIQETRTVEEVEAALSKKGTALVIVNSVCGCAAGNARPAVAMALQNAQVRPDTMITVFAGNDRDATQSARARFTGYRPSSPSIALLRDGEVVKMLERHNIEGRDATTIAKELVEAFEEHCAKAEA